MNNSAPAYAIEPLDESGGTCDCCGEASRSVWGMIHHGDATVAAYWMHWTVGHLDEPGANLENCDHFVAVVAKNIEQERQA